jgi:hypothetical protein
MYELYPIMIFYEWSLPANTGDTPTPFMTLRSFSPISNSGSSHQFTLVHISSQCNPSVILPNWKKPGPFGMVHAFSCSNSSAAGTTSTAMSACRVRNSSEWIVMLYQTEGQFLQAILYILYIYLSLSLSIAFSRSSAEQKASKNNIYIYIFNCI